MTTGTGIAFAAIVGGVVAMCIAFPGGFLLWFLAGCWVASAIHD